MTVGPSFFRSSQPMAYMVEVFAVSQRAFESNRLS